MDDRQAEFLRRMRLFIYDHIVGAFAPLVTRMEYGTEPAARQLSSAQARLSVRGSTDYEYGRYEQTMGATRQVEGQSFQKHATTREMRRPVSVSRVIDELQDRLFEVDAPAWDEGPGGALRGQRMFGPKERRPSGPLYRGMKGRAGQKVPVYEQEQAFSQEDQELLMDLAAIMRSVSGTSKCYLAALLQKSEQPMGTPFEKDEKARLKIALEALRTAEIAFKSVPKQIDLVRERRAEGRPPRVLSDVDKELMGQQMRETGLSAATMALLSSYVLDDEDEPIEKESDDGDIFNDFAAAVGGLRQAWLAIILALSTSASPASEEETAAAYANFGLPVVFEGPWREMAGPQRQIDPATGRPMMTREEQIRAARAAYGEDWEQEMALRAAEEQAKATPNFGTLGWPRAACM